MPDICSFSRSHLMFTLIECVKNVKAISEHISSSHRKKTLVPFPYVFNVKTIFNSVSCFTCLKCWEKCTLYGTYHDCFPVCITHVVRDHIKFESNVRQTSGSYRPF